jgi:hypothetical protein
MLRAETARNHGRAVLPAFRAENRPKARLPFVGMPHVPTHRRDPGEPVGHLLSLGLTQLSIQVTLSTSLTASALGLAALATALTSTILTVQGAIAPYWQWTLLPSIAATVTGLLATAAAGAEHVGRDEVYAAYEMAGTSPDGVGVMVLGAVQRAFLANESALKAKERLTAATLLWLFSSALLIGILNVSRATLGL